jgi:hypothetical protein
MENKDTEVQKIVVKYPHAAANAVRSLLDVEWGEVLTLNKGSSLSSSLPRSSLTDKEEKKDRG